MSNRKQEAVDIKILTLLCIPSLRIRYIDLLPTVLLPLITNTESCYSVFSVCNTVVIKIQQQYISIHNEYNPNTSNSAMDSQ